MEQSNDIEYLREWVGKPQTRTDVISEEAADFLAKTFDHPAGPNRGERLPPLWHFGLFLNADRQSELGRDGHGPRGGFLPPVGLPRRMWASGAFNFHGDLHVGDAVERRAAIRSIDEKTGRSGTLIFVTIDFEYFVDGALRVSEEKLLVYRDDPDGDATPPAQKPLPEGGTWSTRIDADPVMLFRYSALTFNGHRIHYDRDYARDIEGYEGLLVHGPLTATLLAGLAEEKMGKSLRTFSFRALSPIFDGAFSIDGKETTDGADIWATTNHGGLAMAATATF